jgi:proline iminopeptidase
VDLIPDNERDDIIGAYHKRLTSPDKDMRMEACKRWANWELSNCALVKDQAFIDSLSGDDVTVSLARIECHYFMSQCFFDEHNAILNPQRIASIAHIPTTIVQGRYDLVCPPTSAWELYRALPDSTFILAPEAGHASSEKGVKDALHWAVHHHAPTTEAFV